jgi:hypothetical protein
MPLDSRAVGELDWYFRVRRGELVCPSADRDLTVATAAQKYGAARFQALYRVWLQSGYDVLRSMQLPGRFEFVQLPHQYLQLTPLVGGGSCVENSDQQADNLAIA